MVRGGGEREAVEAESLKGKKSVENNERKPNERVTP